MTNQFHNLNYHQLDDGTIRLEQIDYAGETSIIDAHPEQLLFIARSLCRISPEPCGAPFIMAQLVAPQL